MHGTFLYNTFDISIHALRGEGDGYYKSEKHKADISIHALRGEGDAKCVKVTCHLCISIHALRGEGDLADWHSVPARKNFNPRPPWGGRQVRSEKLETIDRISIHALRGEGDHSSSSFPFF